MREMAEMASALPFPYRSATFCRIVTGESPLTMGQSADAAPVHPGEVLKQDFMTPRGLSATALAAAIGVTPARVSEIVRCRRGITAETALRLAKYSRRTLRAG